MCEMNIGRELPAVKVNVDYLLGKEMQEEEKEKNHTQC